MSLIDKPRHLYKQCPLCKSLNFKPNIRADCRSHPLYNSALPGVINWLRCDACGHGFTDGYFTEEAINILFGKANDQQLPNFDNLEKFRPLSARIIEKVSSVIGGRKGKWLDVGFGNGALMTTCEEYGFESVGIDLRQTAVNMMKQLGYNAYRVDFNDYEQFDAFTVISMADVLEHMPYPKEALSHAYSLLISGGALFLSCPNADSVLWKVSTKENKNPYWLELEHYHNFGRNRLYSLLAELGFKPLNYSVSERYRIGMEVIALKATNN